MFSTYFNNAAAWLRQRVPQQRQQQQQAAAAEAARPPQAVDAQPNLETKFVDKGETQIASPESLSEQGPVKPKDPDKREPKPETPVPIELENTINDTMTSKPTEEPKLQQKRIVRISPLGRGQLKSVRSSPNFHSKINQAVESCHCSCRQQQQQLTNSSLATCSVNFVASAVPVRNFPLEKSDVFVFSFVKRSLQV